MLNLYRVLYSCAVCNGVDHVDVPAPDRDDVSTVGRATVACRHCGTVNQVSLERAWRRPGVREPEAVGAGAA